MFDFVSSEIALSTWGGQAAHPRPHHRHASNRHRIHEQSCSLQPATIQTKQYRQGRYLHQSISGQNSPKSPDRPPTSGPYQRYDKASNELSASDGHWTLLTSHQKSRTSMTGRILTEGYLTADSQIIYARLGSRNHHRTLKQRLVPSPKPFKWQ